MKYNQQIQDLFHNAKHIGKLDPSDTVFIYNNTLQDINISFSIQVDNGRISKALFQTTGNTIAIAVSEYLCEQLQGQPLPLTALPSAEQIMQTLNIDRIYQHNVLLILQALKPLSD